MVFNSRSRGLLATMRSMAIAAVSAPSPKITV